MIVAFLVVLLAGAPPSVEDPQLQSLVERAKRDPSPDGRARAIDELRTSKVRGATKELAPQLAATKLGDRESRALLALFAAQHEDKLVPPLVNAWMLGQLGEYAGKILPDPAPASLATPDAMETAVIALPLLKVNVADGQKILATLATHPDPAVAVPASKAAVDFGRFLTDYTDHWLVLLSRPATEDAGLKLIAKKRNKKAIGPVIAAMERARDRFQHSLTLEAITGFNLGTNPAKWRKWWEKTHP